MKTKSLSLPTQINNLLITSQDGEIWFDNALNKFFFRIETAPDVFTDIEVGLSGGINIVGGLALPANYPAATIGQAFIATNNGQIGGGAGPEVEKGELILCIEDTAGGDEAAAGFAYSIQQLNIDLSNIDITGGTIVGITEMRASDYRGLSETDPAALLTDDRTLAGADAFPAEIKSGKGGNDPLAGGVGGASGVIGGAGGDTTDDASTAGNGGDGQYIGGDGGDALGVGSNGGDGGNAVMNPGEGGAGASPGLAGFSKIGKIKMTGNKTDFVAKVGGGQDGSLALTESNTKVDTVASLNDSVTLPGATVLDAGLRDVGMDMRVVNDRNSAFAMNVYPFPGDHFAGLADDVPISVAPNSNIEVHCFVNKEWELV